MLRPPGGDQVISFECSAHRAAVVIAVVGLSSPAFAQGQMLIDRGLLEDLPYTVIYPDILATFDDGNPETIVTLQHPQAFLQCDVFAVQGGDEGWSAQAALQNLNIEGIEADWASSFPGFRVTSQGTAQFQSGAALLYEAQSDNSPMGFPINLVHAEAVDGGRTYAIECLVDSSIAADARTIIDVIIYNFSTRSDGQCCIDPTKG
jgi:hypothetical protein